MILGFSRFQKLLRCKNLVSLVKPLGCMNKVVKPHNGQSAIMDLAGNNGLSVNLDFTGFLGFTGLMVFLKIVEINTMSARRMFLQFVDNLMILLRY